jgi:hypothetical protein
MIYSQNLAYLSGDDLNVERQTWGLLRVCVKDLCVPRQARFFSTHGLLPLGTFA